MAFSVDNVDHFCLVGVRAQPSHPLAMGLKESVILRYSQAYIILYIIFNE